MSIALGVEGGSMLVPELVWLSSASTRLVGGFIMSIPFGAAGAVWGMDSCMEGMSDAEGCWVCASVKVAENRTNGSRVAASIWGMGIPSLEECIADRQRGWMLQGAKGQEWNQIRSAMRGGE